MGILGMSVYEDSISISKTTSHFTEISLTITCITGSMMKGFKAVRSKLPHSTLYLHY